MNNNHLMRIMLFVGLLAAVTLAIMYRDQLDGAALETWVREAGPVAPLLFMLIYALAAVLFLPGSVLTLAGGALFGPVLGTFYNLTGATLGATLAFLITRYLASDWVAEKTGGRVKQLINGVEGEGWRFIRPVNIFVVDDRFAAPIDTTQTTLVLGKLSARECSICHQAFYDEWRTTIHSKAWTDPYFQIYWEFDDARYICRLCHTPLDRQLPHTVLGYNDKDKWDPILADNPDFDPELQHEGVTCAACHYREGKIVGVLGDTNAPHPVIKLEDPNQICVRCHIVEGKRWDTFFRFPPCGTVAEIESTLAAFPDK